MVSAILYIIGIVCAVWVIMDVFMNQKKMKDTEKIIWVVLAIFFSIITAIAYYFMRKR